MRDCSFGIIPFRIIDGVIRFLLVWDARGRGHWTFPKGHARDKESKKETAVRELYEETDQVPVFVFDHDPILQEYSFKHRGKVIDRRLEFFIALLQDKPVDLDLSEVGDYSWMTIAEVIENAQHKELHENAQMAYEFISNLNVATLNTEVLHEMVGS